MSGEKMHRPTVTILVELLLAVITRSQLDGGTSYHEEGRHPMIAPLL